MIDNARKVRQSDGSGWLEQAMSFLPCEIKNNLPLLFLSTSLWASAAPAADRTAVVLNSGMMPDGDQYMIRHGLERSMLDRMHAPIAYFIGGETDIAYANAEADWSEMQQRDLSAIIANMDVGHGATYSQPNGGSFTSGPLAWLQWQLRDDAQARAMFVGNDCGYCTGSVWDLRRHNID